MLSKEEMTKILDTKEDIITYKADKDYRCLTSTEKALLENNRKIKEYIEQLERENKTLTQTNKTYKGIINKQNSDNKKLIEKLEEDHKQHIDLIQEQYNRYSEYYARTGGYPNQMKQDVAKLSGEKNKIAEYLFLVKGENNEL